MGREYAAAGVNRELIDPFKYAMREMGRRMFDHPLYRRNVRVGEDGSFWYINASSVAHRWVQITEGLGNKNWIAEWMYQTTGDHRYFAGIGVDTAMMAVVDLLRQGALPVVYTTEVAAGDSEWFADEARRNVIVESFAEACRISAMAIVGGESPSLRYLVKAEPPVRSAPVFSGCAVGIIAPAGCEIRPERLAPGALILGAPSSGIHANGISLIIQRALPLRGQFLYQLPNSSQTVGEAALIPTANYVPLVEALLGSEVEIQAIVPVTGDGVAKLLRDPRPFTYRIHSWVKVPPLMQLMLHLGVSLKGCLQTFNWGIGMFFFVTESVADRAIEVSKRAGCELVYLGHVEEGARKVVFEPEKIELLPER